MLPVLLRSCRTHSGAGEAKLLDAEQHLGGKLPGDYREILLQSDGLDGFIGNGNSYLHLWSVSELLSLNDAYSVSEFAPGVTLVGTNGADTGYGFIAENGLFHYVAVPLVGMATDATSVMGRSFVDFLVYLAQP